MLIATNMTTSRSNFSLDNSKLVGIPSRPGPEADLVMEFIHTSLPQPTYSEYRTIFIEPNVGAMRPDIVVILWNPKIVSNWPDTRIHLELIDLQILQTLLLSGPKKADDLARFFPKKKLDQALQRISNANCTEDVHGVWRIKNIGDLFAINKIISFEAKISQVSKAIDQAFANTWFSSESYILIPSKNPQENIIKQAKNLGVGIWAHNKEQTGRVLQAKSYLLPFSYGSWLFNEMVWRQSRGLYQ